MYTALHRGRIPVFQWGEMLNFEDSHTYLRRWEDIQWILGPRNGSLTHCSRDGRERGGGYRDQGTMKKLPPNDLIDVYIYVVLASKVSNSITLRFEGRGRKRGIERRRWIIEWQVASLWETWWKWITMDYHAGVGSFTIDRKVNKRELRMIFEFFWITCLYYVSENKLI